MNKPKTSASKEQLNLDILRDWVEWARKYGTKVIDIEYGPEENTWIIRINPGGFPRKEV